MDNEKFKKILEIVVRVAGAAVLIYFLYNHSHAARIFQLTLGESGRWQKCRRLCFVGTVPECCIWTPARPGWKRCAIVIG